MHQYISNDKKFIDVKKCGSCIFVEKLAEQTDGYFGMLMAEKRLKYD